MKKEIRIAVFICLAGAAILFTAPFDSYGFMRDTDNYMSRPGPTLLYPVTDNIVLTGKEYLEFRWIKINITETDHFDFRLYKGYDTIAPNLIFKQRFSAIEYPIRIPVSIFEAGQVYSWVLVQVYTGGEKSDRSSSSFKVINK
ncbi:MAG: hypothetical protein WC301_05720 [Candidatus Omnitrophota bacterium]|jgi:hypothetical protein